jgi:hypothetical protein
MALSEESVVVPVVQGEGKIQDRLTNDTFARDTLTKADRLDIVYLPVVAMVDPVLIMPDPPAEKIAAVEAKPGASPGQGLPRSAISRASRTLVMLPRPRPKARIARNSPPAKPAVETIACFQPEGGLSSVLMAFSGQPRCG